MLMLLACAGPKYYHGNMSNAAEAADYDVTYDEVMSLSGGSGSGVSLKARGQLRIQDGSDAQVSQAEYGGESPQERMVNYTGSAHLENSEPEAVIDTVIQKAIAKGGSVSNRRNGFVSLQIPVAEFKTFFNYILTLGKVTDKNIFAQDITDAYSDNAARLRIAESTLARLQELLAVAKTEEEKVALLKEIQRVSEQIEQRKLLEKELLRKAAFSTINLWVRNAPVKPVPYRTNIKAFEWFEWLADLPETRYYRFKALKLSVPQDFIETIDHKYAWGAASALNTVIVAFEKENEPQGTPEFWTNAMLEFFKSKYNAELKNEILRLQTSEPEPKVYYIAILKKSDKKTLKIAVTSFPSIEAEQRNSEAVIKVLKEEK